MNAVLLSHNGLGDNIFMIGAIRFLLNFYEKIYFLCKNKYYENVKFFFNNTNRIIILGFDEDNEDNAVKKIIKCYDNNENDIFICGYHKNYLQTKITNKKFLNYKIPENNYTICYDTMSLQSDGYNFVEKFYKDINLNLKICFDYFELPLNKKSEELYNSIKKYNIIFTQIKTSDNKKLNIENLLNKYLYDKNTILICVDKNLYYVDDDDEEIKIKRQLSEKFLEDFKVVNYFDTIINSKEIYIIDSCFIAIIIPLLKTNKLKAEKVRIIERNLVHSISYFI